MLSRSIYVTTSFVGFHCWPAAPEAFAFLRDVHRHVFHVRVECEVIHGDRQIEFFALQSAVDQMIAKFICPEVTAVKASPVSCEWLAEFLLGLLKEYPIREIEVSEDGENGSIVRNGNS